MSEWVMNSTVGGEAEGGEGGQGVLSACARVDRSQMYHNTYCDGRMSLALMIAMLTLGFITVLVNLGVIIRAIKIVRQGHDKPAFFFIGNLALSDFAVGLYVVTAFLLHVTNRSDLWRQKTCMLQIGVAVTACQETIFTIVLISVDKYLYICHGLHYSRMMTRKRVYGALVLSWCLAILIGSLPAMGLHVSWDEACNRCTFAQVISTSFAIIFFVTSVAVPLVVVVALYSILLVLAVRMHKARYGGSYTSRESARSSNFRLSFMSKKSRASFNTTKTSISSSSSASSSTSKASRRRTRRQEMEAYKVELRRRDGVDGFTGGVIGGGLKSSPLAKISESAELIDRTENGVENDVDSSGGDTSGVELSSPPPPPNPDPGHDGVPHVDSPTPENPITPTKDTTGEDAPTPTPSPEPPQTVKEEEEDAGRKEEEEEEEEEEKETHISTQISNNGITREEKEEEEEEDATTTDEEKGGGGQGKKKKEGKRGAMFPSKYMNKVMTETRDKMLFLKKCRAVKTVLLILVSFSATYVPFVVGSLIYSAQKEKRPCLLHLLNTLLYCAVVANSLANPLIYAYGYSQFRVKTERFKGIFAREKKRSYT